MGILGFFASRSFVGTMEEHAACHQAGERIFSHTNSLDVLLFAGMGASAGIGLLMIVFAIIFNR